MDLLFLKCYINAVIADLHRIGGDAIIVAAGWFACDRMEIPPVPWAPQVAIFDGALSEGASLVGAPVVQSCQLSIEVREADGFNTAGDRLDPSVRELVTARGDLVPDSLGHSGPASVSGMRPA